MTLPPTQQEFLHPEPSVSRHPVNGESRSPSVHDRALHFAIELQAWGHHPATWGEREMSSMSNHSRWIALSAPGDLCEPACVRKVKRIRAVDLAHTKAAYNQLVSEAASSSASRPVVLADVEVLIAPEARQARRRLAELELQVPTSPSTLRYVGTPVGLAGLLADIGAARVADGVTILPLVVPDVLDQLMEVTLPWLRHRGLI